MISVVMATYNGEKYIKEQLESILNQSWKPDEIVINDDNSTDKTIEMIQSVENITTVSIKLEINDRRLGYAQNFRRAINRTKGEIIFLCDQDDIWLCRKIESCMKVLEKRKDILALSSAYYITDKNLENKRVSSLLRKGQLKKVSWKQFIRHPKYPGMATAFRKEIWPNIDSLNWKTQVAHDWMINQYAAYHEGLFMIGDRLVLYRQHGENTTGILRNYQERELKAGRIKIINEMINELMTIQPAITSGSQYIKQMITFQKKRKRMMQTEKWTELILYELSKPDLISLRSILGDIYVCAKSRKKKHV